MLMARPRHRAEEYSLAMTVVQASTPPMPRPVSTRQVPSCHADPAVADSAIPAVASATDRRMSGRRPIRSATGARVIAPTAMPINPALRSTPIAEPPSAKSAPMLLAVKARAMTS